MLEIKLEIFIFLQDKSQPIIHSWSNLCSIFFFITHVISDIRYFLSSSSFSSTSGIWEKLTIIIIQAVIIMDILKKYRTNFRRFFPDDIGAGD